MTVSVEKHQGVITATLDDGKANALGFDLLAGLRSALERATTDGAPLVIAGRVGYFSAGFDLQVMRSGDRDQTAALAEEGARLFEEMFAAPVPVIVACTGHALAAGALLLLSADYRIGGPGPYTIGLNETRIGIALPQFAIDIARVRLRTNRLIAATLFARILGAEEACDFGYLDQIESDAPGAARALAEEMASLDPRVFAKSKQRINADIVLRLGESHRGEKRT